MAKKIQAWATYGPRVQLGDPMTGDEIIENIVGATNQSKGSVLAVLSELDVQLESGLKAGRIVKMPNGTHYEPVGKRDGSVNIKVRVNREIDKKVNNNFRGKWANATNKGVSEEDLFAQWDAAHPEDPVEM